MTTELETITGLRIVVSNAALQLQRLHDEMVVGGEIRKQAETTQRACDVAAIGIQEASPLLRKLTRAPRKNGGGK